MNQGNRKTYWKSIDERQPVRPDTELVNGTVSDPVDGGTIPGIGRRQFLKLAGFTVGASAIVGCSRGKDLGAIPYLVQPEEVIPGRAYWYASVCGACPAGCGILAKARDGRPIKLEGNPGHPLSAGGMCAVGQASVLGLYDSRRLRNPLRSGQKTDWKNCDREIVAKLESIRAAGGSVRFLTDSTTGPAEEERIDAFLSRFGNARRVTYDPISVSAIADAHRDTHGERLVPHYWFDLAGVIVGMGADFLGTWISPVEHTAGYRQGRRLENAGGRFSHHVQFESRMTLTGSNADRRLPVPPGSLPLILAHLADRLARRNGSPPPWSSLPACPVDPEEIAAVAERLWNAPRGATLVVCGENDLPSQRLTNYCNHLLGNYRTGPGPGTVDLETVSLQLRGDDAGLRDLLDELEADKVDALFVRGGNPLYDLPGGERIGRTLEQMQLVVSFAAHEDETARLAHFVCPEPHFLESWGDSEPIAGLVAIRQPAIRRIGSTRPLLESLAVWSGAPAKAHAILKESWRRRVFPRRKSDSGFDPFWNRALHDGFVLVQGNSGLPAETAGQFRLPGVTAPGKPADPGNGELLLELHPSAVVGDGRHALNPWLQELPDPITKTVWDNFGILAPAIAETMQISTGDLIRITTVDEPAASLEIPALVQPGQDGRTLGVSLGYGRSGTERFTSIGPQWWESRPTVRPGGLVGVNAAPLLAWSGANRIYSGRRVRVEKTGRRSDVACSQVHHTLSVPKKLAGGDPKPRPIVQETTLDAWRKDPGSGSHHHADFASLWPDHPKSPHHWGMVVDLAACTGCSACVVSCQAENNIPVVGKDEVRRAREMHWMRIDRYYSGDGDDVDVVHMPMMCQHCDNAPCETVCPVLATVQSAEGLNQQIYNRCVGTRYCANNCPYKVRRFNWFQYSREDRLQNLVLNPDVTVRSRGVMEKCSLCVQRIQGAKAEAKRAGRPLQDGDIQPACAQSCPAGAIVFGDMNDPDSRLTRMKKDPRHYDVLAELGVKPVVGYMTLVRNRKKT